MAVNDVQAARLRRIKYMLDRVAAGADDADACRSMAQTLMLRHGITEMMLPDREKTQEPDEIGQIEIYFTGIYAQVEREVAERIAEANDCRFVVHNPASWEKNKTWGVTITGWKSDLAHIEMLNASVRLQCKSAVAAWSRENKEYLRYLSAMDKYKNRREFIASFANGLFFKLTAARGIAKQEAAVERATETGQSVRDASSGVELALRTRRERVDDWYDEHYAKVSLRTIHTRRARGGQSAREDGWAAGRTADTGQTRVGGGNRAIEG